MRGFSLNGSGVVGSSPNGFAGEFAGNVSVVGFLSVSLDRGGTTTVCRNEFTLALANCNSSSLRYKTNLAPYRNGLDIINRLRPIRFDWKQGGMHDVGFGAEDVAKIEPLLITHNDKGEVEGVKYDRLSVVFVNAFKEQQAQIANQQKQINAFRSLVCSRNRRAKVCRSKN